MRDELRATSRESRAATKTTWVALKISVPIGSLFIRVPYYTRDLKRDPNLENYPHFKPRSRIWPNCTVEGAVVFGGGASVRL